MSFSTILFTEKGKALQAKASAGIPLVFTKIKMGSGKLSGQSQITLTDLIEPKVNLNISEVKANNNYATVKGMFTNNNITTDFYWREIGVFAQDPNIGEILYCYGNAGELAEHIPPSSSEIIEKVVSVSLIVGDAANVSAVIDESLAFATKRELNKVVSDIGNMDELQNGSDLVNAINMAFQSASNGKEAIKAAITGVDPEVTIPTDATFAQLATAIGQIETGVNTDDATATAEKILAGMTAYVKGIKVTGTMPYRSKDNNHPAEDKLGNTGVIYVKPQKGYYEPMGQSSTPANVGGWISVDEPNLRSANIRANTSIFGVQGDSNVVNTSDGTIDAGKILTGYGGYSKGVKYNGSMPNIGQQIITPSTANQNIAAGYHNGVGYVKGDANLIPANILSGKSIFGVVGSLTPGKKYATGTTINSATQSIFIRSSGGEKPGQFIKVSNLNLGFTPRIILYYCTQYPGDVFVYFRDGFANQSYTVMARDAYLYADKYAPHETLYSVFGNAEYTWFAWE